MTTTTPSVTNGIEVTMQHIDRVLERTAQEGGLVMGERKTICRHCGHELQQRVEKALDGEHAMVWATEEGWTCPVINGDEHVPMAEEWFIVVERLDMKHKAMPPYVVGPYPSEAAAEAEGQEDEGHIFCLLTIDAKSEHYVADDCYWTTEPPEGDRIFPPIKVTLDMANIYPGGTVNTTFEGYINPPPDNVERESEGWEDWAYDEIFQHTGTGNMSGDAGYFVTVAASNLPNVLPVGTKFEWGT